MRINIKAITNKKCLKNCALTQYLAFQQIAKYVGRWIIFVFIYEPIVKLSNYGNLLFSHFMRG